MKKSRCTYEIEAALMNPQKTLILRQIHFMCPGGVAGLQMVPEVFLVDVILSTEGALDVSWDVLLAPTISAKARLLMGGAVLFGIELFAAILTVDNVGRIMGFQMTVSPALASVTFLAVAHCTGEFFCFRVMLLLMGCIGRIIPKELVACFAFIGSTLHMPSPNV